MLLLIVLFTARAILLAPTAGLSSHCPIPPLLNSSTTKLLRPFPLFPAVLPFLLDSVSSPSSLLQNYSSMQFLPLRGRGAGLSTARMASSNTVLRPFCVRAEHSRYLTAEISLAICRPWAYVIGDMRRSRSFSIVSRSSRRSTLVPTRMIGVPGAWWFTSGYHCETTSGQHAARHSRAKVKRTFDLMFSNDGGLTSEKQTRKTSVWGYESGRRRS